MVRPLPRDAIRVGQLDIRRLIGADTYRVRVTLEVPRVRDGRYAVWVCRAECGADSGFGDVVYGHIVVARDGHTDAAVASRELAAASGPFDATWHAGAPCSVLALAALVATTLAGALALGASRRRAGDEVRT